MKKLIEERNNLVAQARKLVDSATDGKLDAESRKQYDAAMTRVDEIKVELADAERREKLKGVEDELGQSRGRQTETETGDPPKPQKRSVELRKSISGIPRTVTFDANEAHEKAFRRYIVNGPNGLTGEESRALQKDADIYGGYLSAPQQFQATLIQAVDNLVWMRQISNVLPPIGTAESLGIPSLDADPADPTWVTELVVGSEDSTMSFGKRELRPHPNAQFIKVSKTLLRRSAIDPENVVMERLAYKNAVVQETAFMTGNGNQQPLGIFTASANGINTDRDFSAGNTATSLTFDGLLTAKYGLKPQYRNIASWVFHTDAIKMIAKLKDGEGRYIWQPSVQAGQPDLLLNRPIYESAYAPNTFTQGLYVGMLADFSKYMIVDALTLTIQVLTELYAATNQNGYIVRAETDGMPVLSEAFARVTLA